MKVFLSFSGVRGKAVADSLGQWLQQVLNAVEPWVSTDIDKGSRWLNQLSDHLEGARFGIICLTSDSLDSPWLTFEAGALSKTSDAHVCTFLVDLTPADVVFPLAQFQHTLATKEDTRKLVQTISRTAAAAGERTLSERQLDELFEVLWPRLDATLKEIREDPRIEETPGNPLDHAGHEFITARAVVVYQAEELPGKLSRVTDDPDASTGRCRYARIQGAHLLDHMIFGPYEKISKPGNYIAFFRIKIGRDTPRDFELYLDAMGGGGCRPKS